MMLKLKKIRVIFINFPNLTEPGNDPFKLTLPALSSYQTIAKLSEIISLKSCPGFI